MLSAVEKDTQLILRKVAHDQPPSRFGDCSAFLKNLYDGVKTEAGRYSYRQLSEDLGFSHTNVVHLFIQGRRPVSQPAAGKLSAVLGLKKGEKRYFEVLARLTQEKKTERLSGLMAEASRLRTELLASRLDQSKFAYYNEWYHVVIREMVAFADFKPDPHWIAARVEPRITPRQAADSLQLLQDLDLISIDAEGNTTQTAATVSTGPELQSHLVRQYHQVSIPQGLTALARVPREKRQVSALTLCLNEDQFQEVKKKIEAFQAELLQLEKNRKGTAPDRVMQLNMQFFPSTEV